MSFLDRFFGRKKTTQTPDASLSNQDLMANIEIRPGLVLPKVLANQWANIEKTRKLFIAISATPADNLALRQSKFGHYPCIPKGFAYPLDKAGDYMYPLAQINCSELPSAGMLPSSGYLQFYIGLDDVYGLSFDEKIPSDVKVLFFEEHQVRDMEEDLSFLDQVLSSHESPVNMAHSLTFQVKEGFIGIGDYEAERNPFFSLQKILEQYPSIEDELSEFVFDNFSPNGHKLGGYAYFTQSDPREYSKAIQDHVLLFQMDSDDEIMWGDVGVANFFIHPDDLMKKDFSKVIYNWDCS